LTGFFLIKSRISSKYPIFAIFSTGVDALPLEPESPSSVCQTGRFTGLFEIQSFRPSYHTSRSLSFEHPAKRRVTPAPSQTSGIRPPHPAPIRRAAANERGGGGPTVRAVDAGCAGEGVCGEVVIKKKTG